MGLVSGLFVGFISGIFLVAVWSSNMAFRAKDRFLKASYFSVLSHINQDDVKKLCSNSYPEWLSFSTFERVTWLNEVLEKIWPYTTLASSQLIKPIVEPMLAMYCPSGFKMKLSKVFLGNVAPHVEGIKLQSIQSGQLMIDLDFKWGGDPNIILAVQTPVGANLPIQVLDKDVGSDKLLGVGMYPLSNLVAEESLELTLPLLPSLDVESIDGNHDRGSIMIRLLYHKFSKEEQAVAMAEEKALLDAKKAAAVGLLDGSMDTVGDDIGGAGKSVPGAGIISGGAGLVSKGIGKAGKFVTSSFSSIKP